MTDFSAAMRKAADLTRSYKLMEATRVIQAALAGRQPAARSHQPAARSHETPKPLLASPDMRAEKNSELAAKRSMTLLPGSTAAVPPRRARHPLGEAVRLLREGRLLTAQRMFGRREQHPQVDVPEGAQYLTRAFAAEAGTRSYKLYIPASHARRPRGLVVMLHGCNQNPDDFAAGTAMNQLAEIHGLLIAYPQQTRANNPAACWNWFRPGDQSRGEGEPAILAGLARELAAEFNLARERTFAAGLSAGGAMAMVLAETYPDVFGAVGIHSGLDYKSATDVASAFSAMRGSSVPRSVAARPSDTTVRTIVFHGAADPTVHPSNADRIAARLHLPEMQNAMSTEQGADYTRLTFGPERAPIFEKWSVDGLGHAWSGGNPAGSFTDARGPNASAEMVRFFVG